MIHHVPLEQLTETQLRERAKQLKEKLSCGEGTLRDANDLDAIRIILSRIGSVVLGMKCP